MITYLAGFLLILAALLALALQRLYSSVPAHELKRLASQGDHLAQQLYRAAAYGPALHLFLWSVLSIALPAGVLLTVPKLSFLASFLILAGISFTIFIWLPSLQLNSYGVQLAARCSALLVWLLSRAHPVLDWVADLGERWHNFAPPHSRLYEKEDLQGLLTQQQQQADNRIDQQDLELARRALIFGDRQVADSMQPRQKVLLVSADETIGPVLLDQLHQSGQNVFFVYKDDKDNIIGTLSMTDAIKAKQGGRVLGLVQNNVAYAHEDFSLRETLAAFQHAGQRALLVINKFEEFVGVITFDQVLSELLGENQADVAYEDRRTVANFERQSSSLAETEVIE